MVDVEDTRLWSVCEDIYVELYKHATPQADFFEIRDKGEAKEYGWWEKYTIEKNVRDNLIIIILAYWQVKKNLTKDEVKQIYQEVVDGCSPSVRLRS